MNVIEFDITAREHWENGSFSRIYIENDKVYKVFESYVFDITPRDELMKKLKFIKNSSFLKKYNFILPDDLLFYNSEFIGYSMRYVKSREIDITKKEELLFYLEVISHFQKLNFFFDIAPRNFLFNNDNELFFCDADSVQIARFTSICGCSASLNSERYVKAKKTGELFSFYKDNSWNAQFQNLVLVLYLNDFLDFFESNVRVNVIRDFIDVVEKREYVSLDALIEKLR